MTDMSAPKNEGLKSPTIRRHSRAAHEQPTLDEERDEACERTPVAQAGEGARATSSPEDASSPDSNSFSPGSRPLDAFVFSANLEPHDGDSLPYDESMQQRWARLREFGDAIDRAVQDSKSSTGDLFASFVHANDIYEDVLKFLGSLRAAK